MPSESSLSSRSASAGVGAWRILSQQEPIPKRSDSNRDRRPPPELKHAVEDPAAGEHLHQLPFLCSCSQSPSKCCFAPIEDVFYSRLMMVSRVYSPLPFTDPFSMLDVLIALGEGRVP
ncbi:MAG: hypothetical protein ACI9MC_003956 [Kiritimatiellia bacterium]